MGKFRELFTVDGFENILAKYPDAQIIGSLPALVRVARYVLYEQMSVSKNGLINALINNKEISSYIKKVDLINNTYDMFGLIYPVVIDDILGDDNNVAIYIPKQDSEICFTIV